MKRKSIYQLIKKTKDQRLPFLDLKDNGLTEIPGEIFELTHLHTLNLSNWHSEDRKIKNLPEDIKKLKNLQHLDLGGNELKYLPAGITEIRNLRELDLSGNYLCELKDPILSLEYLQYLDLSGNRLRRMPENFSQLKSLKNLYLKKNRLERLPDSIFDLRYLAYLDLSFNELEELPGDIGKLKFPVYLYLNNNLLTDLPKEISKLSFLEHLDICCNHLVELPKEVYPLKNLRVLEMGNNQFKELPKEFFEFPGLNKLDINNIQLRRLPRHITKLKNLKKLNLRGNALSSLPREISQLKFLEYLDISHNQFTELPREILKMGYLRKVDLSFNQIIELPDEILELKGIESLNLEENPLKIPPPEIAHRGILSVRNYFREMKNERKKDYLYEVKLLLVGEAAVGKTSLAKSLSNPDYILEEEQFTKGIDIMTWAIPKKELGFPKDFRVNIWDFGGQEVYHATHQFFFTKRSIYLLVTETRREGKHEDFYYWLNCIKLLGDESPVIIVMNKCDQPIRGIPIKEYRKSFPNIVKKVQVSCVPDQKKTIEELKKIINEIIASKDLLHHIGAPLPGVWAKIRMEIEERKERGNENYITYKKYLDICSNHNMDKKRAEYLIEFFHDLGIVLHFKDDPNLRDTVFLNPEWLTKPVYKLFADNDVIKNNGRFNENDVQSIWKDEKFRLKHHELLSLMKNRKFELCYALDRKGNYLAPQLLPVDEIDYTMGTLKNNLHFEYRYQFMPKGILTRFIVKRNEDIYDQKAWRYGVILAKNETRAIVRGKYFERKVTISIEGPNKTELLEIIRKTFQEIHNEFKNLEVKEMIPCNCPSCKDSGENHFFDYELLEKYKATGINEIICEKSMEFVGVDALINDIFTKKEIKSTIDFDIMIDHMAGKALRIAEKKDRGQLEKLHQEEFGDWLKDKGYTSINPEAEMSERKEQYSMTPLVRTEMKQIVSIFAPFRLNTIASETKTIVEHLDKLVHDYQTEHHVKDFVLIYVTALNEKEFQNQWKQYIELVNGINDDILFRGQFTLITFEDVSYKFSNPANVKVGIAIHERANENLEVCHMSVRIG